MVAGCEGGQYNVVVAVVEVVNRDFLVSCTRKKEVPLWKSRQNFGGKKVVRAGFWRKKVVSLLPSVVLEAVGTEGTHSLLEGGGIRELKNRGAGRGGGEFLSPDEVS